MGLRPNEYGLLGSPGVTIVYPGQKSEQFEGNVGPKLKDGANGLKMFMLLPKAFALA